MWPAWLKRLFGGTPTPTLLCVGSGLAARYRANTLQALAMPAGAEIQFRYSADIVPESLHAWLPSPAAQGATVLMGHVDGTDLPDQADGACLVVPYRQARLVSSKRLGSFFVLQLRLEEHRVADDLVAFQGKLGNDSPRWKRAESAERPIGMWCQDLPDALKATRATTAFEDWQTIAKHLQGLPDFRTQPYFYKIDGIFEMKPAGGDAPAPLVQGEYRLRARRDYELRLIHFDPAAGPHARGKEGGSIKVEVSSPLLVAQSDPTLKIDSPYDAKTYAFSAADITTDQRGSVGVRPEVPSTPPAADDMVPPVYFSALVNVDMLSLVGRAFVLGFLLSGSQLVPALLKGEREPSVIAVTVAFGFVTGIFVIAGLKRPL